jgi:hypothetical protein
MSEDAPYIPSERIPQVRRKRGRPRNPGVLVDAYPEPYVRKKRGRPKKVGRPKLDKQPHRASPSMRPGKRYKTITVSEETYYILKELSTFYKVAIGVYIYSLVLPAFDHAYQESLTLQRIEENRKKAKDEIPDTDDVPRRTHF